MEDAQGTPFFRPAGLLLHLADAGGEDEEALLCGEEALTVGVVYRLDGQDDGDIDFCGSEDHGVVVGEEVALGVSVLQIFGEVGKVTPQRLLAPLLQVGQQAGELTLKIRTGFPAEEVVTAYRGAFAFSGDSYSLSLFQRCFGNNIIHFGLVFR